MKPTGHCPQCDRELQSTAPLGLCSQCLLQSILEPAPPEDETVADPSLPTGEKSRAFGDYELLAVLARGGMGVVYRARQISLHRVVALKMIRAGEFASEAEQKRFRAEAEAAAHLDHPNIVPIYEVGEHEGQDYFVMKLIEGGSLAERMRSAECEMRNESGAPAAGEAIPHSVFRIPHFIKVARAVHYAHQRGVLHRDLKPANILLDARAEPFVTDFGLAKRVESEDELRVESDAMRLAASSQLSTHALSQLTLTGAVIGTPNYMSPEQAAGRSREITTAADIYSLGAILYELLAGQPPFQADTPLATMRKVMEEEPVPLREVERRRKLRVESERASGSALSLNSQHKPLSTLPKPLSTLPTDRDLETITLKCLQKNRAHRYASAEALAEDLERWLRHEPIHARPSTARERVFKWTRRHPARAGLLAVSVAAVIGFVTLILVHGQKLQRERNHALHQEQKAGAAATRAEAGELAARERAYAADLYAASQALLVDDLAQARRLLHEHRPAFVVPALAGSETNSVLTRAPAEARTTNTARPSTLNSQPSTDLRGFEWRVLWERTRGQEAFAFTNLARPARCLVFAPDGRTLVSGGDNGVHLWDMVERRPLGLFPGPDPGPTNGDLAPTVEDVRPMLNVSPAVVEHLKAHPAILDYLDANGHTNRTRNVKSLAFTPDGKHLLVGSGDYVRSWNFAMRAFDFAVPEEKAMAATPAAGDRFVVANNQPIELNDESQSAHPQSALLYSFTQRRLVAELPGYGLRAVISPDGEYVAASSRTRGVVLWRPATQEIVPISQEQQSDYLLSFAPDGRTLFVGSDVRRFLWDVPSKRIRADLRGEHRLDGAVAWSPDGRSLATGGENQTIATWTVSPVGSPTNPDGGPSFLRPQALLHGHEGAVTALAFSPDGLWLASGGNDHSIRLWATAASDALAIAPATPILLEPFSESPMDSETGWVIGRVGGELTVIDTLHGYAPHSMPGTERHFYAGFLARGQGFITVEMATNGVPVNLEIRRLPDGAVQTSREILPAPKESQANEITQYPRLAASPDGRWLALVQRDGKRVNNVRVYDIPTGRLVAQLPGLPHMEQAHLRVSPDSRWLVRLNHSNGDNWITTYDSHTWGLPREIQFRSAGNDVIFATIDPSSRLIAAGGLQENSLRVWDLLTGRLVAHCHSGNLNWHPVWSRDGRTLVFRGGESFRFWSMIVFRELAAVPVNERNTSLALGFTTDGRALVTLTWEQRVKVWSPPTLAEIDLQP